MFSVLLPHSKRVIDLPVITFKDVIDLARLQYAEDNIGLINYIERVFNIASLNCVDKLYVILKARELFFDEEIVLSSKTGNVSIPVYTLTQALESIDDFTHTISIDNIKICLDVPHVLFNTNTALTDMQSIIKTINVDEMSINFSQLDRDSQDRILTTLPSSVFTEIKKYLTSNTVTVTLFKGSSSLPDPIKINLFTSDVFSFIRYVLSEYTVDNCREIIYHISKRVDSTMLLNSTMQDIKFYLKEYTAENKAGNTSNTMPL